MLFDEIEDTSTQTLDELAYAVDTQTLAKAVKMAETSKGSFYLQTLYRMSQSLKDSVETLTDAGVFDSDADLQMLAKPYNALLRYKDWTRRDNGFSLVSEGRCFVDDVQVYGASRKHRLNCRLRFIVIISKEMVIEYEKLRRQN